MPEEHPEPHSDPWRHHRNAVDAACAWFDCVTIADFTYTQADGAMTLVPAQGSTTWARFYELDTDRPVFFMRDSSVHYDVNELSAEDRNRYEWYGDWGLDLPRC